MSQKVELPGRRLEMICQIKDLSDFEMQKEKWVDPNYKHAFSDDMRFPAEMILDECCFHEPNIAFESVGWKLVNEKEAEKVEEVAKALHKVTHTIGYNQPDSSYLNSPLWKDVVQKAKEAYDVLMEDEDLGELCYQEETRIPSTVKEGSCSLQDAYFAMFYLIESRNQTLWNSVYFSLEELLWVHEGEVLEEKQAWKLWVELLKKNEVKIFDYGKPVNKWNKINLYNGYRGMVYFLESLVQKGPNFFLENLYHDVSQGLEEMEKSSCIEETDPWKGWVKAHMRSRGKVVKEMCLKRYSPTISISNPSAS